MSASFAVIAACQSWDFSLAPRTAQPNFAPPAVAAQDPDYRVLVTASREWVDPLEIWEWLNHQYLVAMDAGYTSVTVIHGNAAGGDQIAKLWGTVTWDATEVGFDAQWDAPCIEGRCQPHHRRQRRDMSWYCPAAGMYRNELMVNIPPHVVGAFIRNLSSGTTGCVKLARDAGLVVVEHYA